MLLPAALLVALTLLAYLPALGAGFVWDDDAYVTANPTLRTPGGLLSIWLEPRSLPQYYPLVHTSFWLETRLWGFAPAGFHAVNVLLHAGSAILAYLVLSQLRVPGALVAAALFAVHPVNVESVAWITERKNVLSLFFYLLSFWAYLRFDPLSVRHSGGAPPPESDRNPSWYPISLAFFAAALLSKTVTSTLPVSLLLLIWLDRGRVTLRDAKVLAPYFLLGLALGLVTVWMERVQAGAAGQAWALSPVERILIAGRALLFYAGKLAWPASLSFIYPRWSPDASSIYWYAFPAAVLAVLAALFFRGLRAPLVAVLFFAVTLFPALGFFDVYPFRFSFVADHFQYHASLGLLALVAALGTLAAERYGPSGRRAGMIVASAAIVILAALTWQRTKAFADEATLWRDTIAVNPDAWIAHNNLGRLLAAAGKVDEAKSYFATAVELAPDYAEAQSNLGNTLAIDGKLDEAIAHYRAALRLEPDFSKARTNLGNALLLSGRTADAIEQYRIVLEESPSFADAHGLLARALESDGRRDDAIAEYREALRLDPRNALAREGLERVSAARAAPPSP